MNAQEIFETVSRHLFVQGKQSRGADGRCAYRGEDNQRCAVGVLIPDALYHREIEGCSVHHKTVMPLLTAAIDNLDHNIISMLDWLQNTHDRREYWINTAVMRDRLVDVGKVYECNTDFLSTLSFEDR